MRQSSGSPPVPVGWTGGFWFTASSTWHAPIFSVWAPPLKWEEREGTIRLGENTVHEDPLPTANCTPRYIQWKNTVAAQTGDMTRAAGWSMPTLGHRTYPRGCLSLEV